MPWVSRKKLERAEKRIAELLREVKVAEINRRRDSDYASAMKGLIRRVSGERRLVWLNGYEAGFGASEGGEGMAYAAELLESFVENAKLGEPEPETVSVENGEVECPVCGADLEVSL